MMLDTVLETVRTVALLTILVCLWRLGAASPGKDRSAWRLIIGGLALLSFGSLLDISDNFDSLNRFVVIGNTATEALLENVAGFLGGGILVALGVVLRVRDIRRPDAKAAARTAAEQSLCDEAAEAPAPAPMQRIADLEEANANLELKCEDLIHVADEMRTARDEAERANRAKTAFLVTMSHELRTPLNAVIGFSEIMKGELLGPVGRPEYREYSRDIHESGQHLLSLINDLLDLAKIESGKDDLVEEWIDVPSLIRSTASLARGRAARAGVEIEISFDDELPMLRADERKLKQILTNLLINAVKFTENGGSISVKCWARSESGFVIQVVDTGIGIAPEDIHLALSQFGQIDNQLSRKNKGTGLGLPLAKAITEQHGGSLDLQSEPGKGTTVTVRLPAWRIRKPTRDTASPVPELQQATGT